MDTQKRRLDIIERLQTSQTPLNATFLAGKLNVTRQVIVGDVAILRATGHNILATPKGYILKEEEQSHPYVGIVACQHTSEQLKEELYTIIDFGGTLLDVTIEHPIYGQLSGLLNISSRYEADLFIKQLDETDATTLSNLTDGIHLHKIGCKSLETFDIIKNNLQKRNLLL